MATITMTIPDAHLNKILDAFDTSYPDRPKETTKIQWFKMQLIEFARRTTMQNLRQIAETKIVAEEVSIT